MGSFAFAIANVTDIWQKAVDRRKITGGCERQVDVKDIAGSIKKVTAKTEEVKDIIELVHSLNCSDRKAYILIRDNVKCS